jgi:hypothetical protein
MPVVIPQYNTCNAGRIQSCFYPVQNKTDYAFCGQFLFSSIKPVEVFPHLLLPVGHDKVCATLHKLIPERRLWLVNLERLQVKIPEDDP